MYQVNFAFGLWLSGEKCVECSCDRHGRLLLRQTQQRSGMHRKLSFVEGFALLWTILLRSSWELFHQASLLPILGQLARLFSKSVAIIAGRPKHDFSFSLTSLYAISGLALIMYYSCSMTFFAFPSKC